LLKLKESEVTTMANDVEVDNTTSTAVEDDKPVDRSDIIQDRAFRGEYSYDTIIEGITNQMSDYMNLEDDTDYVSEFYNQFYDSYDFILNDDQEEYKDDAIEYIFGLKDKFTDFIRIIMEKRLNISIDEDKVDAVDMEWTIRHLYEFFIIGARENFKTCISKDVIERISNDDELDDKEYFQTIDSLMDLYTPLLQMTPTEFLKYRGDEEVIKLFDTGMVSGNFLRKYSPKLYANEEFKVELINHITMIEQFKDEVKGNV
jgi:hypothetical protein